MTLVGRNAFPVDGVIGFQNSQAMALILPSKKIADVKTKSVVKRMKEKSFARNVDRADIERAGEIGLSVRDFLDIAVNAMKGIADDLSL